MGSLKKEDVDDQIVVLFGAVPYFVFRCLEYKCRSLCIYDPGHDLRAHDGAVKYFRSLEELETHLVNTQEPSRGITVVLPAALTGTYHEDMQRLVESAGKTLNSMVVNINTAANRGEHIVRCACENVSLIGEVPIVQGAREKPAAGRPAFMVAAGPSLDKNVHVLRDLPPDAIVLTVNTALPAVHAAGVYVDFLCVLESLDVTTVMEGVDWSRVGHVVASMNSNPAHFRLPVREAWMALGGEVSCLSVAKRLGVPLLDFGGSVANMAVAVALDWGCDPVVLVGQDLGYSEGGKVYASGTKYSDVRYDVNEGEVVIQSTEFRERVRRQQSQPKTERRPTRHVPGWGGGQALSSAELITYRDSYTRLADLLRQKGDRRTLINATEGGVSIPGFAEEPLEDVVAKLPRNRAKALPLPVSVSRARGRLVAEQELAETVRLRRLIQRGERDLKILSRYSRRAAMAVGLTHVKTRLSDSNVNKTDRQKVQDALDSAVWACEEVEKMLRDSLASVRMKEGG